MGVSYQNENQSPPNTRAPFWSLLLSCAVLLAAASSCSTPRPAMERFDLRNRVSATEFPDVDAVVLLDRREVTYNYSMEQERPFAEERHHQRIQLMGEAALGLRKFRLPYDDRSRILHVQARIIKPDGRIINMPDDRTVKLPRFSPESPAAKLYNDDGFLLGKIGNAEVGDIIELSYQRIIRDPRWLDPLQIGGEYPVIRGEVIINHPRTYEIDFRVTRFGELSRARPTKLPTQVPNLQGGEPLPGTRLVFVFEDEPAIYPEPLQPKTDALSTQVHVTLVGYRAQGKRYEGYRHWNDVGRWYNQLTSGNDVPDEAVKELIRKRGGRRAQKGDKLLDVQQFLQNRIVDVPNFLNLSSLPARPPVEILRHRIGDSKDQASLGLAMLRAMGLDAFPILVSEQGSFASLPDLPTPALFNHVILAIPSGGDFYFLDPGTPDLPPGRLPGSLQGQRGLLVRQDGSAEFIDLPTDPVEQNTRDYRYSFVIDGAGQASGQIILELSGLEATLGRQLLRSGGTEVAQNMQAAFGGDRQVLKWQSVHAVSHPQDADKALRLQVVLEPAQVAERVGQSLVLSLAQLLGQPHAYLWRERRQMPLLRSHRSREFHRLTVEMPAGYGITALPHNGGGESPLLQWQDQWSVANGALFLERNLVFAERTVSTEQYPAYRTPIERLWQFQKNGLELVRGGDRGENYGDAPF